jgi:hypothetical protein
LPLLGVDAGTVRHAQDATGEAVGDDSTWCFDLEGHRPRLPWMGAVATHGGASDDVRVAVG